MTRHVILTAAPRDGAPDGPGPAGPGSVMPGPDAETVHAAALPMFAAAPAGSDDDGVAVAGLRELVRGARSLTLRATAVCGGPPGSLANGLALLAGPDYGRRGRGETLRGVEVILDLDGPPRHRHAAARQLTRMAHALGAATVRQHGAAEPAPPAGRAAPEPAPPARRAAPEPALPGPAAAPSAAPLARSARSAHSAHSAGSASADARRPVDAALGQIVLPDHPWLAESLSPGGASAAGRLAARYCPPEGHPRLLRALRDWLAEREPAPDRAVAVTAGASLALPAVLSALLPAGAGVLVPDPGYPPYRAALRRLGLRAVPYPAPESGRRLAPEALAAAGEARAVLWNSPGNPTGWTATEADLQVLADHAHRHDLLVISDEVYRDLAWGGGPRPPGPCDAGLAGRTVVLDSASKRYAAAGLRVGWVHGPPDAVAAVASAHWDLAMSPPTLSQLAAAELVGADREVVARVRGHLAAARAAAAEAAPEAPLPEAGPYLWLPAGASGRDAARAVERDAGLRVMPGEVFGERGAGRVRVNLGALGARPAPGHAALAAALALLGGGPGEPGEPAGRSGPAEPGASGEPGGPVAHGESGELGGKRQNHRKGT